MSQPVVSACIRCDVPSYTLAVFFDLLQFYHNKMPDTIAKLPDIAVIFPKKKRLCEYQSHLFSVSFTNANKSYNITADETARSPSRPAILTDDFLFGPFQRVLRQFIPYARNFRNSLSGRTSRRVFFFRKKWVSMTMMEITVPMAVASPAPMAPISQVNTKK